MKKITGYKSFINHYSKLLPILLTSLNCFAQQYVARVEAGLNKWILINEKGEQVSKESYGHMALYSDGYIVIREGGKWGYINTNGEMVIPANYITAMPFSSGLAAVSKFAGMYEYIDKKGVTAIPGPFCEAHICTDGVLFARKYGELNFRLFTYNGKELNSENLYKEASHFVNGYAAVCTKKGVWQIINNKGEVLFEDSECSYITNCKDGMFAFRNKGRWGFIDSTFRRAIPAIYEIYSPFGDGYARVVENGKVKLIDKKGNEISWSKGYEDLSSYSEGLIAVKEGNLWGFTNETGRLVIPCQFSVVKPFKEGLALVKIVDVKSTWGYISRDGDWVIKPILNGGKDCKNGFVIVEYPFGKCGFMTSKGETIPGEYNHARNFVNLISLEDNVEE